MPRANSTLRRFLGVRAVVFSAADFQEILALHKRGLRTDGIVTHKSHLSEAARAFAVFASGESGKVLIVR